MNINTEDYWNMRFRSGDWEARKGRSQTEDFALSFTRFIKLKTDFTGTIVDFGCGLGDAIPIYRKKWPNAKLIGVDFSKDGIEICNKYYGEIASFICGDFQSVPQCDVIIASNVFEHLSDQFKIIDGLLKICKKLIIVVPFNEILIDGGEHINNYRKDSFSKYNTETSKVFSSKGWSYTGFDYIWNILVKNCLRPFFLKRISYNKKQILYVLLGRHN